MALTDTLIRSAKPAEKPTKLFDEKGLFLLVQPSGGKLWRLKYRFNGKENKLTLGQYPEVSLKDARKRRDEARKLLADGIDPSAHKKAAELTAELRAATTFNVVAEEYLEKAGKEGREAITIKKSRWLVSLMSADIGKRPIAEITPPELLSSLRKVEAKGNLETARRMRSIASRIFRYAVSTARATSDPALLLRGALTAPVVTHHSAILQPKRVGQLLRAIDGYEGQPLTQLALKLTPHLFVRPGELRRAEWNEFDLDAATWTIPAEKMKMRSAHRGPVSRVRAFEPHRRNHIAQVLGAWSINFDVLAQKHS